VDLSTTDVGVLLLLHAEGSTLAMGISLVERILDRRFAQGEIDKEEYEEKKSIIQSSNA
jgi:uncharacterized membrane protein